MKTSRQPFSNTISSLLTREAGLAIIPIFEFLSGFDERRYSPARE